jgi:hypothetical protein
MWQYAVKIFISAAIIVAVSELAKRSSFLGALLASLPLTSLLAFIWLYLETGDSQKIAMLSGDIFWLVLPSLVLFIALPVLLRYGVNFWLSLAVSGLITVIAYFIMLKILPVFNVNL